jgi:hypothetical protein
VLGRLRGGASDGGSGFPRERTFPVPEGIAEAKKLLEASLGGSTFPVYGIQEPSFGSAMIGDSATSNGVVEVIGVAYGNPLIGDPVVQVMTAPKEVARTVDYLLDMEMLALVRRRGDVPGRQRSRPTDGACRVLINGAAMDVPVKAEGQWWAMQLEADEVVVSVIGNVPRPFELALEPVPDLAFLLRDRSRAIAEHVRQASELRRNDP